VLTPADFHMCVHILIYVGQGNMRQFILNLRGGRGGRGEGRGGGKGDWGGGRGEGGGNHSWATKLTS
jgi:hypothetical protein